MSHGNKDVDKSIGRMEPEAFDTSGAVASSDVSSIAGSSVKRDPRRISTTSERQIKFERAQKCLENAALVSKRIKEHRKATAELLGKPFEDDDNADVVSDMASTVSEYTSYSVSTDVTPALSVADALNIPGISESLANTLKQKEKLMERIKQYKEISKRPMTKSSPATIPKREPAKMEDLVEPKKIADNIDRELLLKTVKEKETALSLMEEKVRAMETTILDLQEKINEKDMVIDSKTKATSLMSDNLSKKEKDSVNLLEDTRQQMIKMQENFIAMESEWKEEKRRLVEEIQTKNKKIVHLEEANSILENARFEISVAHSKLAKEIENKNIEILNLKNQLDQLLIDNSGNIKLQDKEIEEEEKGSREIADMVELSKKIELLEQLNCQIRKTNVELENKLASYSSETKPLPGSSPKRGSPLAARKGAKASSRNTTAKLKSPWSSLTESTSQEPEKIQSKVEPIKSETVIQSLNKEILDKEYFIAKQEDTIRNLKETITQKEEELKVVITKKLEFVDASTETGVEVGEPELGEVFTQKQLSVLSQEKETELGDEDSLLSVNELQSKLNRTEELMNSLNNELDSANKNMIKVKSAHKLKIKQMQKTIDNFSKMSDANTEVSRLSEEVNQLTQKVAELEEEKGNLQLHLVDYDSGRLSDSETYRKLLEMETLADSRLKAISELETQKFDLVQELHTMQQKNVQLEDKLEDLSQLQNEQVCVEMKSVQLEEQLDKVIASKNELELFLENTKLDKEQLTHSLNHLQDEKDEVSSKLEQYIQENIELSDRLEKLSAEKVSSAESIEIVESLTTQEKKELEEYSKNMLLKAKSDKQHGRIEEMPEESQNLEFNESLLKLSEESAELNKKIELFTLERHEVMEKMNKISLENDELKFKISQLTLQTLELKENIDMLSSEKSKLISSNDYLNREIEQLQNERIEMLKETPDISKQCHNEDTIDVSVDNQQGDKSRIKAGKQSTKEILKLKNVIKEREAEIADCQMKILSLEELRLKQSEAMQSATANESTLNAIVNERDQLKEHLDILKQQCQQDSQTELLTEEIKNLQNTINSLESDKLQSQNEYQALLSKRDEQVQELEKMLSDYENQIISYNGAMQQKDKDVTEYINQITKLNDVSQKLKSTIDSLEEEKANDKNADLVKSLNKQISLYQTKLTDQEKTLKKFEEEKSNLSSLKSELEIKNVSIETDLNHLRDTLKDKQVLIKELQQKQEKHLDEVSLIAEECKEKDEEIHEVKLELRKESIENETLRKNLNDLEKIHHHHAKEVESLQHKLDEMALQNEELASNHTKLTTKNKELLEKLKKIVVTLKNKTNLCANLETELSDLKLQVEQKQSEIEKLLVETNSNIVLQNQVALLQEELNHFKLEEKVRIEELEKNIAHLASVELDLTNQNKLLNSELNLAKQNIEKLTLINIDLSNGIEVHKQEVINLSASAKSLESRLCDQETDQKNNDNFVTQIASLEADINEKQIQISELLQKIENVKQDYDTFKFGHEAKIQERDLYIESLETEIAKYKSRIYRLEESISAMEDRRHSLERKADQLDNQLQEKQKAYSEYSNNEDELINRLAVLMDHDQVVEKQLHEIEKENKELQFKMQKLIDDNHYLKDSFSKSEEECNTFKEKADMLASAEVNLSLGREKICELESQLKRIANEHQNIFLKKQQDIDYLESEFNTQIQNAIKEKKILNERCEKMSEYILQLEQQLQECGSNIEALNINLDELSIINKRLTEKLESNVEPSKVDYTEQYISEINKIQSINGELCRKNEDLNQNIISLQLERDKIAPHLLETQKSLVFKEELIDSLNLKLENSLSEINQLQHQLFQATSNNTELQNLLVQRDEHIRQLFERSSMRIEMNIPKTEGMFITSTIEPLKEDLQSSLLRSIQSQIVAVGDEVPQVRSSYALSGNVKVECNNEEETIMPKKAYQCFKKETTCDSDQPSKDPFNSDEGWGLDEDISDSNKVASSHLDLDEQVKKMNSENQSLKTNLNNSNAKLLKALKKLKELNQNNERITAELVIAKQLSQSPSLDSAIEDELTGHIKHLEKKVDDLLVNLNKEKSEKVMLIKQNEVFTTANNRLIEIKEKMDSELELWKFKFKEANDKISALQWDDQKPFDNSGNLHDTLVGNSSSQGHLSQPNYDKLEKENDELQVIVDQLSQENSRNLNLLSKIKDENTVLKKELLNYEEKELNLSTDYQKLTESHSQIKEKYEKINNENTGLLLKTEDLASKVENLRGSLENSQIEKQSLAADILKLQNMLATIENDKSDYANEKVIAERKILEKQCELLTVQLNDSLDRINCLQSEIDLANDRVLQNSTLHENRIVDMDQKTKDLNAENDKLLSEVAELRSTVSTAVDQRGYEVAEMWKQHLSQRESDFSKLEQELRSQLNTFENKYEQLLDNVQSSSQEETCRLVTMEQLSALQNKLKDKDEHVTLLQNKHSEIAAELELLRSEMEDEKTLNENKLLGQQEEYERLVTELTSKNEESKKDGNITLETLSSELLTTKEVNESLNNEIVSLRDTILALESRINEMIVQSRVKESEVYQKVQEYSIALTKRNEEFESIRKQMLEYEQKIEELTYEKESEVARIRLKLHEQATESEKTVLDFERERTDLIKELETKIDECEKLNKHVTELNKVLDEYASKTSEMQTVLENQEIEIVTLKDEVSTLQENLRVSALKIEKHVTFASGTKLGLDSEKNTDETAFKKEFSDLIPRAELDLALYMLHQRDVRCEELTLELTQLLDERDTLQLRLSDCLRSYEELRFKCNTIGLDLSVFEAKEDNESNSPERQVVEAGIGQSTTMTEIDEGKPKLQAKLTELRSVRQSRDVRFRNESEQRQMDMRLLQSDVANLPPEAAEQLRQAHHTLSRDSQSTSTVLLNWLRGKSTPKVVHM